MVASETARIWHPVCRKKDIVEKELSEEITAITNLRDQLLSKAESLKSHDIIESQICENMAWALEFHRREAKPVFWRLLKEWA